MGEPNLFDYATSELSQDAFWAWFLQWAEDSDDIKPENQGLHDCAKKTIIKIFNDYKEKFRNSLDAFINVRKFKSVKIIKQKDYIDLLVVINDKYNLIIEDKTDTKVHDNQLKRYRDLFSDKLDVSCFVYLKTGELNDDDEIKKVKKSKYIIYGTDKDDDNEINSFLDLFKEYESKITNQIFCDYYGKYKRISELKKICNEIKDERYKTGIWDNYCLYVYFIKSLKTGIYNKYFALDVWLEKNYIRFDFHAIEGKTGKWVEDLDEFKKCMKKNKDLETHLREDNYPIKDDCFFSKKESYDKIEDVRDVIKSQINKILEQV